jgi:hypothetical protein
MTRTVCVVDHGEFVDLAKWLEQYFSRVLYMTPWQCASPNSNQCMVGCGVVEKIESIWDHLDEIDLFIFPDIYHSQEQIYLESIGKRVWGSREGENLEIWRAEAKNYMEGLGITIGPYQIVKGTDELRKALKGTKDKFVKISKTRGDFETFKHNDWSLTEPWLADVEHRIGPKKKIMEFIVEDAIDPAVEVGFDGYCIDGKFSNPIVGVEIKDEAYLGKVVKQLPDQLQDINDRLSSTFKAVHYRNFFCSEVRIKGGKGYMLDPCCRIPSPPGNIYTSWFKNLPEILWEGGGGTYVEPQYAATWGAELIFGSEWSNDKWTAIEIPDEFKDNLKLRVRVRVEGKDYVTPGFGIGGVVAVGSSASSCIDDAKRIAKEVKGLGLTYKEESLDKAKEEFDRIEWPKTPPKKPDVARPDPESLSALLTPKSLSESLGGALR